MSLRLIAVSMAILLLFSALSGAAEIKPQVWTDDIGRSVCITKAPERIVSLSPSNTEILFALGLGDGVVGVTPYCNYPSEVENLRAEGKLAVIGGYINPDIEKILSLNPDMVFANTVQVNDVVVGLDKLGIPTYVINANNLSGIISSIKKAGKATGNEAEASDLTGQLESRIMAISKKVGQLPKKKDLYVVWQDPVQTVGVGACENEIIEKAGGTNIFHDLSGYPQIDVETIALRNPEVIITCTGMGAGNDKPFVWAKTEHGLSQTDARRDGQVYQIDGDIITRSGPRIVDALEMFARFIHQEAF
jgi:iron complex transport system substrate-binding protein